MGTLAISTTITSGRVQLVDIRRGLLATARGRLSWVIGGFTACALGALVQLGHLGLAGEPAPNRSLDEALLPPRGEIVDRNGVPLARELPAYSLWFNPHSMGKTGPALVKTPAEVAAALVQIFPDEDVAKLEAKLAAGQPCYLRKRILPEEANRIHALGEPALEFPQEEERYYPQGSMAAHVLGFVDKDGQGKVGMEQVWQQALTDKATRGSPQVLSIDTRVQGALEDELQQGMAASNAKGAAGVVLDVDTGEVLALASLPSFNPNLIDADGVPNIFNRETNQVYELGSVMKPITIAAAIEAGVVTDMAKRYPAGPLQIGSATIHDHENYGATLNVPETLVHSSNIVSAEIGLALGGDRLKAAMEAQGFNQRPTIELPARGFPIWPRGEWSRITTAEVAFGQGLAITPLHLASAYAALVNGGIWHPTTLHRLQPGQQPQGRQIWQASTSARMRQLLRMIVAVGTGRSANAQGFRVGGKTGSAQKAGAHGYAQTTLVTTFAAAFPMDHPRYVVVATMDEPQGTEATHYQRTAAWNAAPVVGRLVPRIGPLLGVMPDDHRDVDISDIAPLVGNGNGND